jgi:D-glycero-alpha-D-manno-heptose-7-phosphate kinase
VAIEASAPVRICDLGGWTDTWFGGPGRVLNVAVTPGVEVLVRTIEEPGAVVLDVNSFGDRYRIVPGDGERMPRHPLLEAALDAWPPPTGGRGLEIRVRSVVPPGCGTGTSAAVAVALLGALAALRSEHPSPLEVASAAHRLEVERLGAESGVQDQLCAALGGINFIEIERYPEAAVTAMPAWDELGPLLTLVYLGRPHDSAAVHRQVIAMGEQGHGAFDRLRQAAADARDAVLTRDLEAFGLAMQANTAAQRVLHAELVGRDAEDVMRLTAHAGALGAKVNGAGGDGGSVTILSPTPGHKEALEHRLSAGGHRVLPIRLSQAGLQVRDAR